jgi:hypothetical protein
MQNQPTAHNRAHELVFIHTPSRDDVDVGGNLVLANVRHEGGSIPFLAEVMNPSIENLDHLLRVFLNVPKGVGHVHFL